MGGAVVSTGWRRAPLDGGPTVWVAIVGSGGTKGPLLGGPFGGLRAGASPEGNTPAGLVERFLRSVHGCPSLIACTAQLASELGAPWALSPTSALWGRIGDCPPCMGCKSLSYESCAAGESAVTSLSSEALPYCSGRDS